MDKSNKRTGWAKLLSGSTYQGYGASFSSSFANISGKSISKTCDSQQLPESHYSGNLVSNCTTFFEDMNKGVITLPNENVHIHTVVCPATGANPLPKKDSIEGVPFYSWLKNAVASPPIALTTNPISTTNINTMNAQSPATIRSPQSGSAGPPLHGIGAGGGGLGSASGITQPSSQSTVVVSPTATNVLSAESFTSTLPPIPIESVRAASALGCSALLFRIVSYEDATKEPRTISIQINDVQLRSCKIQGGKKRSTPRNISEVFFFPTLQESVDIHVTIGIPDGDFQQNLPFAPDDSSSILNSSSVSTTGKSTSLALVKAKAVLDAMLYKNSLKSSMGSPNYKSNPVVNGKTSMSPPSNLQLENISEKDLMENGLKSASIWGEQSSLLGIKKVEPVLASTIFHVDLSAAARTGILQWFELIVPASTSSNGNPGPWGFSRLLASVAALYTPTPAKSMWRPRTASLLSLVSISKSHPFSNSYAFADDKNISIDTETHKLKMKTDYLTLLQTGSSSKIPVWRRFWAVVAPGRILLYPYQHKETTMPVLTIELGNIIGVKTADPERLSQNYSFHLISDRGIRHSLYADSASSLEKWIYFFQSNCQCLQAEASPKLFSHTTKAMILPPPVPIF